MRTYPVMTDTNDLALQALLADFIAERLQDHHKTAIAFVDEAGAMVKTNADREVFEDACLEAGIRMEAWLRVYQPRLSAPKVLKAA